MHATVWMLLPYAALLLGFGMIAEVITVRLAIEKATLNPSWTWRLNTCRHVCSVSGIFLVIAGGEFFLEGGRPLANGWAFATVAVGLAIIFLVRRIQKRVKVPAQPS